MSTHTPGPWVVTDPDMDGFMSIKARIDDSYICRTYGWEAEYADEERANALLIAAAPDLLSALDEIVAISDRKHDAWDRAKAAIAKAKGKM